MARSLSGSLLGKASHRELFDLMETDWSKYPESNYWKDGAEWAKGQIYGMFDKCGADDRLEEIIGKFYNRSNSWMTICLKAERMLDLIKALK